MLPFNKSNLGFAIQVLGHKVTIRWRSPSSHCTRHSWTGHRGVRLVPNIMWLSFRLTCSLLPMQTVILFLPPLVLGKLWHFDQTGKLWLGSSRFFSLGLKVKRLPQLTTKNVWNNRREPVHKKYFLHDWVATATTQIIWYYRAGLLDQSAAY